MPEENSGKSHADEVSAGTHNEVSGTVMGPLVQARTVHGGIHLHHSPPEWPIPRQLPVDTRHFVGRSDALTELGQALDDGSHHESGVVAITAISGTAGIGKTALAIHWAHQIARHFPDGQLYINLRGFDARSPVEPEQALHAFLSALGVEAGRIPLDLAAQAALFRSMLDGRRVLIVLGNARDAEHVRPLLPASRSCLAVITTRNRVDSLVVREGVHRVILNLMSHDDARALLAKRMGRERVDSELTAATDVIQLCGRLPLALSIVAARAAAQSQFPISSLAEDLMDERTRLDALDLHEADLSIEAVFSWSSRLLTAQGARLFELLGAAPGSDVGVHASAVLADMSHTAVNTLLTELTQAHLVEEYSPRRYRLHDLLRAYATKVARSDDELDLKPAMQRLLDFYLHTSHSGDRILDPLRESMEIKGVDGHSIFSLVGRQQAQDWFAAEHDNLLSAARYAADNGLDEKVVWLAWSATTFLHRGGHWYDYREIQRIALLSALRTGERRAQAITHRNLGNALAQLKSYDEASENHRKALALFVELGDERGQARVHHALGYLCEKRGDYATALEHGKHALTLYRARDDRAGEARALNAMGWYQAMLQNYEATVHNCEQALTILRTLDDPTYEAHTLDSLGYAYHHMGSFEQAISCFRTAIEFYRELEDQYYYAATLHHLGDTLQANGNAEEACAAWREAGRVLDDMGHSEGEEVSAKLLASLTGDGPKPPGTG
ncbi:tetratricopeptide repeat protein [Streptomyces sp. NPDC001185]|uniref:ATP-binding protein n=1 Tax=Streptomyces sp. NPDC001185 TaxID=3154380 RepID=UPI00331C64D2